MSTSSQRAVQQRDIFLVPFPFSDLAGQKVRPVLVLSNTAYNRASADVLVCGLTTNLRALPYSIIIETSDVERVGTLRRRGKAKADTIASLKQSLLIKRIARLKTDKFEQVVAEIKRLISA